MTTLIKNGTIITATDMYKADVLVKNGVITEIGSEISKIASEIIDAADKWVLPGAVDVHTHMDAKCDGMTTVDDFETGTTAAARILALSLRSSSSIHCRAKSLPSRFRKFVSASGEITVNNQPFP